jgi:WD40 repeat protein
MNLREGDSMCGRTRIHLLILLCLGTVAPAAEPKLDRFGDPLPEGAIARLGNLHWRHEAAILSAAFTADGKTLATCHANSISFWDLATGKCVRRVPLKGTASGLLRRLSNDAKVLMLDSFDNVLHFLDAASGAEERTLNHSQFGSIRGQMELSRDGKILATVHRGSIALWDVPGGKLLHEFKEPSFERVAPQNVIALTPDGKQLILPHADGSLHLVDVASGKELRAFEMPPPRQSRPPSYPFSSLALSPDGRYLAFNGWATPLTVCELATGKRLSQLGSSQVSFPRMAFTPNGRFLAVDMFNEVRLFGVLSGKEIRKLPKKTPVPSQILIFSPDGRTLAAFPSSATIHVWDVVAQRRLHPPAGHDAPVKALAFFPDGKRLVSADQTGEIRVWDIASGQTLAERTTNQWAVSLSVDRDGETVRFAQNNSSVHQWDVRTGREEVRQQVLEGIYTNSLVLSPDGRSLALLVPNRGAPQKRPASPELRLYDVKTNQAIVLPRASEQNWIGHLTFTPDSRRLAASCPDGVMRLWDRDTGKLVREVPRVTLDGAPAHLAFAADGRSFVALMREDAPPIRARRPLAPRGPQLRIREIASGADRLQIPPAPAWFSLAYSPDARFFASGQGDGRIFIYSAVSGKLLAEWQGKQGYIFALAFSRDGGLLASGGANGTILVWKVPQDDSVPVVQNAEEADSLWQALGAGDAVAASRALAGLAAAPAQALPIFKERLPSIGKELDHPKLARWIAELDDDSFKVREQATRELTLVGDDAADALRQALNKNPSAESKRRIEDLLAHLKKGGYSRRLRFLRALEALEHIGTPQAKELLRELVGKPMSDELREEVQDSLRRLGEKP